MLLDLFDLRDDLNTVAKKDGGLELPLGDADQGQRGNARRSRAQPASTLSPSKPWATGSPKGECPLSER